MHRGISYKNRKRNGNHAPMLSIYIFISLVDKPQISLDWNKMIEGKKVTGAVGLEEDEVDRGDEAGERIADMRKTRRKLDSLTEEQPLRHSKRMKEQGLGNMISTYKAWSDASLL